MHASECWLESEWLRGQSEVESRRLAALSEVKGTACGIKRGRRCALVAGPQGHARLAEHISTLLAWKSTRILAPALLEALSEAQVLDGAQGWGCVFVRVPQSFRGELPARWRFCDPADAELTDTIGVLMADGMAFADAVAAARVL